MSNRKRPDRDAFEELCRTMTAAEMARHLSCTTAAVYNWARLYGIRPRRAVSGPEWRRGPHVRRSHNIERYREWQS